MIAPARRATAEFVGTGLLVTVVVGSGIAAARLSPNDVGLQLAENAAATAAGLAVIIVMVGPVSGAHLNPVVSLVDWALGRRAPTGLKATALGVYVLVQAIGAIGGAVLANLMFGLPSVTISATVRTAPSLWLAETVATAGLVALILSLTRTGRAHLAAPAVGAYSGSAYWFTSSISFANPAVTIGRMFSDTFAGIAPESVAPFIAAQLAGAPVGVALALILHPAAPSTTPAPSSKEFA